VISVQMDNSQLMQLRERLVQLPPSLISHVYAKLRPLIQEALFDKLNDHFDGCGPQGGPTNPTMLTQRTSNLFWSVYRSLQISESGTDLKISIGSDLPYARIHEYGGYAGRRGPFKKADGRRPYLAPRPYLQPTLDDLSSVLPELLEKAIQQVRSNLQVQV
jgi:hypothetical protein